MKTSYLLVQYDLSKPIWTAGIEPEFDDLDSAELDAQEYVTKILEEME